MADRPDRDSGKGSNAQRGLTMRKLSAVLAPRKPDALVQGIRTCETGYNLRLISLDVPPAAGI
jgi:hypothetical protein